MVSTGSISNLNHEDRRKLDVVSRRFIYHASSDEISVITITRRCGMMHSSAGARQGVHRSAER